MKNLLFTSFFLASVLLSNAQQRDLTVPEASQAATVTQRIGLTDITINYHSPLTKGRTIWGDLIPYDQVWRAGANENTVITFSTDVKVEGYQLAAGSYGLHTIPGEKQWIIIFSKNNAAWGSFFYNDKEDALRVSVKPKKVEMQEWLSYTFDSPQPQSVTALLTWEKLAVPFTINIDVPEIVVQHMRKELTNINGFFWQGYHQAANYCIDHKIHLDDAAAWIEKSIGIQKTFANLNTKAKLTALKGKTAEADAMKKEALSMANEEQLNAYGYELLGQGKLNDAVEIFRMNVKHYPGSWNAYDSYAEALEKSGNNKEAISNYKAALAKAPEGQKIRIQSTIIKLEKK